LVAWKQGGDVERRKGRSRIKKNPYSHDQPYMLLAPKIVPVGYLSVQEHAPGP